MARPGHVFFFLFFSRFMLGMKQAVEGKNETIFDVRFIVGFQFCNSGCCGNCVCMRCGASKKPKDASPNDKNRATLASSRAPGPGCHPGCAKQKKKRKKQKIGFCPVVIMWRNQQICRELLWLSRGIMHFSVLLPPFGFFTSIYLAACQTGS